MWRSDAETPARSRAIYRCFACQPPRSLFGAQVQDALQGNSGPGGTVAEFITQFVQDLLEFEQTQQSAACLQCLGPVQPRFFAGRRVVRGEEGVARFPFPS